MKNVVFLLGAGCRSNPKLVDYICSLGVPVLTTWQGIDLLPEDSPVFCGRPGVIGQRAANIIQQKSDVLIILGARLDMEQVGHRIDNFAPNADKYVCDIDKAELDKLPTDWHKYQQDLADIGEIVIRPDRNPKWLDWCKNLYNKFRYELDGSCESTDFVDPYYFVNVLSDACKEEDIIVPGSSGMQSCALMQAFRVKKDQKILLCNTIGSMGLEPMAIGAAISSNKKVICVTGDGGFHMNVQELEVVRRFGLNIKYFIFCNDGYGSIVTMQDNHLKLRVASDYSSGLTFPNLKKIAGAWKLNYYEINNNEDIAKIDRILNSKKASITMVKSSLQFHYATKVESALIDGKFVTDSMEDMCPRIDNLSEIMNEAING
jgi:acetolactate synthase-1/2/3 large subunit